MPRPAAFKRIPKDVRRRFREGEALAMSEGNHDGDTFTATIEAKWGAWPCVDIRVRDLRMPELDQPLGLEARDEFARILALGMPCVLRNSEKDYAQDIAIGGRFVCDVALLNGTDIQEHMDEWYAAQVQP